MRKLTECFSSTKIIVLLFIMMSLFMVSGSSLKANDDAFDLLTPLLGEESYEESCSKKVKEGATPESLLLKDPTTPAAIVQVKGLLSSTEAIKFSTECSSLPKYNFGVLINNEHYTIYRSAGMGDEGFQDIKKHLDSEGLPIPQSVIYMNHYGYKKQTKAFGSLQRLLRPKDYKLREFATLQDKELLKEGIKFYHPLALNEDDANVYLDGKSPLEPKSSPRVIKKILSDSAKEYYSSKGVDFNNRILQGDKEAFYNILDIILKRGKQPVLFHCKGGIHRTGMLALAIRYLQGGKWTKNFPVPIKLDAKVNVIFKKPVLLNNLAEYEYFLHNQTQFRLSNLKAIRQLADEKRFKDLKKNYGDLLNKGSTC